MASSDRETEWGGLVERMGEMGDCDSLDSNPLPTYITHRLSPISVTSHQFSSCLLSVFYLWARFRLQIRPRSVNWSHQGFGSQLQPGRATESGWIKLLRWIFSKRRESDMCDQQFSETGLVRHALINPSPSNMWSNASANCQLSDQTKYDMLTDAEGQRMRWWQSD